MKATLSPSEIEFLTKLKTLLDEYYAFISCNSPQEIIQVWVFKGETDESDDGEILPIKFPSQFDNDEINELLENNQKNMKLFDKQ